ncbi:hypothetical protein ACFGVR_00810 [Mucilaginibacter sp. AW1-3]
MQTKTRSVYVLLLIATAASITYFSCKKSSTCTSAVATGIPPFAYLELKDNQDRDLLDPATPGHYDTAFVKRSNSWFKLTAAGVKPVLVIFNYTEHEGANVLNLSAAEQDALGISLETINQTCSFHIKLLALNYNGTVLNADVAQSNLFIAHK